MGYAYQAIGDYPAATGHLSESLAIFDELQLAHFVGGAHEALNASLSSRSLASGT
jgi:hypothetical protein